jgi:uncharacterized protein (TIGR02449 family)
MPSESLTELEQHIETLIQRCQELQQENADLRQRLAELNQSRNDLLDRNQQAANQVKRIIAQLKDQSQ